MSANQQPVRLFIAHVLQDQEDIHKVIEYVESKDSFVYVNTADINAKPEGAEAIQEELRKQIGLAEVMIVPVNVYQANPKVIDYEIRVARNFDIPVLGVQAFGGTMEVPKALLDSCSDIVEWEPRRMILAIKALARNEPIPEYEVIEFTLD